MIRNNTHLRLCTITSYASSMNSFSGYAGFYCAPDNFLNISWLRRLDSNQRPSDNESDELTTAPLRDIETVLIWRSVTPAAYICLFGHINGTALRTQYIMCSLVRMTGLKPAASSAQTTRSLKLSYIRIY